MAVAKGRRTTLDGIEIGGDTDDSALDHKRLHIAECLLGQLVRIPAKEEKCPGLLETHVKV